MRNGLVIADSGPIISLAYADKLWLLDELFDSVKIPNAVWEELTADKEKPFVAKIELYFSDKVLKIKSFNELTFAMDYGESESVILYKETFADFLLIDDKKARKLAENFDINCIGIIGILSSAKDKGLIQEMKPIFECFIANKRFYSRSLLNKVLELKQESRLES